MLNLIFRFILIFIILTLFSCDDFILKKTVTISNLVGNITFDPSIPQIKGILDYEIKNNQNQSLTEIYLISHENVLIEEIVYNDEISRFYQGYGYGYNIYRIKIPVLKSDEKSKISIKFYINGPYYENRFLLNTNEVYFDSKKIWVPVPFAEIPLFFYKITINVPENFYSVMGGKLSSEILKNKIRRTTWESENENVFLSGTLFIGNFQRYRKENLFIYSKFTNNFNEVANITFESLDLLKKYFNNYPYSQTHIIFELFQYQEMEEFIDGEFLGNIIQISPDFTSMKFDNTYKNNNFYAFIPRNTKWRLYEIITHELLHAYIGDIIKFEENEQLEQEIFTEFAALLLISTKYPSIYRSFINQYLFHTINLYLKKDVEINTKKYLIGLNYLYTVFNNKQDLFFKLIKTLIEKYSYTKININDIISTCNEFNLSLTNTVFDNNLLVQRNLINTDVLSIFKNFNLYNIKLNISNNFITNLIDKSKTIIKENILVIENTFPISIPVSIIIEFINNIPENYNLSIITNQIILSQGITNLKVLSNETILNCFIKNPYENLEYFLFDNFVTKESNYFYFDLINYINLYYQDKFITNNNITINTNNNDFIWNNIYVNKTNTLIYNSNISFIYNNHIRVSNYFYLGAFKLLDNIYSSYVIFRILLTNDNFSIDGILDPLFLID